MERDETALAAGEAAARADVAAGRLVYRWMGHAGHWGQWMAVQLSDRFGVGVEDLGLCCVNSVPFNEGYNNVIVTEIDRRYGNGAFQSLMAEAKLQPEEVLFDAKQLWLERTGDA
jgi:hypothetical protein